jgi:hypothetical protein
MTASSAAASAVLLLAVCRLWRFRLVLKDSPLFQTFERWGRLERRADRAEGGADCVGVGVDVGVGVGEYCQSIICETCHRRLVRASRRD